MHKPIKKYQLGAMMSWDTTKAITDSTNWLNKGLKDSSGNLGINKKPTLSSIGSDLLSQSPQLLDTGLQSLGVKKADTASGAEQFGMGLMDKGAGMLLKSGNPALMGIGAGLTALTALNKFAGTTAKEQGTKGLDTGGYSFNLNENAGKKQTLLGTWAGKTKKFDALTKYDDKANLQAGQINFENKQNLLTAQNTFGDVDSKNKQKLFGGITTNVLSASMGTKINPAELRNVVNKVKVPTKNNSIDTNELENTNESKEAKRSSYKRKYFSILNSDTITKFEDGGKMNVIPDGSLHARKHELPEEIANQVTNKGIPVVTYNESGDITQHAEIELNEIIFNKETTTKLEDFFKKYNESESEEEKNSLLIECGKFLTSEILENTDDKTGLINEIE